MDTLLEYSSSEDDSAPVNEEARVRSFAHEEGNFATHVYITVRPSEGCKSDLKKLLNLARRQFENLQIGIDVVAANNQPIADLPDSFHISLSRVVPVRFKDIDSLLIALRSGLENCKRFEVKLSKLEAFVNDQRTRSFLALAPEQGGQKICGLIRKVDGAFLAHGLQKFYDDPKPHISFAWLVGDYKRELDDWIADFKLQIPVLDTTVTAVWVKMGSKVHRIWSG